MRERRPGRAIVTGSASGIGAAVALRLLADGYLVEGWDVGMPVAALATHPGYTHHVVDVVEDDAVRSAVEKTGPDLRACVHAAGIFHAPMRLEALDPELADRVLRVNVLGAFNVLRCVLPAIVRSGGGAFVNVASESALRGSPGISIYAATKAAVVSLTRTAALEYAPRGVRVLAVAPGATRTPMLGQLDEAVEEELRRAVPLGRLADPEDIADVVAFLLGDGARHLTGEVIAVNGGATA